MKAKAVLVDIDGTLVSLTRFDYDVFDGSPEDIRVYLDNWDVQTMTAKAFDHAVEMLKRFKQEGYALVFLTARGQGCRKYTWRKLREIGIADMVDAMWHRPRRWEGISSSVYKKAFMPRLMAKWDFHYAMDDEGKNLEMMEEFGIKIIDAKQWWSCGCGHTVCLCGK